MATSDELYRTKSPQFDFDMRFFVGPKWGIVDNSGIVAGSPYTTTAETTTTADVAKDDTSIPVVSTSGFPSSGFISIAPNGTDETYEFMIYGSKTGTTFDDLVYREAYWGGNDEQPGFHSSGATVREWVDITDLVLGRLSITMEMREAIGSWTARLAGVNYNSRLLQRDNSILAFWRFRPKDDVLADWTDWVVAFIGYISDCKVDDDSGEAKRWNAEIGGFHIYVDKSDADPHHFGPTDLAASKTVTTSSVLDDPWDERLSGEYLGYPDLDGDNLVDGDIATLWISENEPSVDRPTTYTNTEMMINEVYLQPEAGKSPLQWIEFFRKDPASENPFNFSFYCIAASCTSWKEVEYDGDIKTNCNNNYIDKFKVDIHIDPDGGFVLLVSNLVVFERYWKVYGKGAHVRDWRDRMVGTFTLGQSGDFIACMFFHRDCEGTIFYGSQSVAKFGVSAHFAGHGPNWTGPTVSVPTAGHSMARTYPGQRTPAQDNNAFVSPDENNPTPGGYDEQNEEYASVDLGALNCRTTSVTLIGETDHIDVSSTLGLTESGDILMNGEIIGYTERDDTNKQIKNLTRGKPGGDPAKEHPSDSLVEPYEGGIAYNCHLVDVVRWRRRPVQSSGNIYVVPALWDWMIASAATVIYPDDEDWDDPSTGWRAYWTRFRVWTGNLPDWGESYIETSHNVGPIRARHVMLVVHEMSDGGRAKVNELSAFSATYEVLSGPDGETESTMDGALSGYVIRQLLVDFGLDPSQFTMTDEGRVIVDVTTAKGNLLGTIRDLLKRTGCMLLFGLDENVEHRFDAFHPLGYISSSEITWDRDYARRISLNLPNKNNVSQVILRVKSEQGTGTFFEVRYPAEPLSLGSEMVIEDYVLGGSVTDALLFAQQVFRRENGPMSATVIPVGPAEWVRPGQRHLITWELDTEETLLSGSNFVVVGCEHSIELGNIKEGTPKSWQTAITLRQLEF